ncbi:MAG: MATE family efflux transporter [Clostridia bacterium]|nr:MATE family efflux transporter [Clostridia bacterium]
MSFINWLRRFFGAQDMTVGSPMSCLLKFSIPLLIGNIAQQLYSTVDAIIIGNSRWSDTGLAAVGLSMPIVNLLLVLFMGISTGASILSAQFFGAKDRQTLNRTVGASLFLIAVSGVIMMVAGYYLSPVLIDLTSPPSPQVGQGATDYLQIFFLGIIGSGMYNIISGILRGLGDSMMPLLFLVIACVLNIFLDLAFVEKMGVAGVALATIIAQGVSALLCLWRICTLKKVCDVELRHVLKPDKQLMLKIGALGLPAGITQAVFSTSAIIVQQLTNRLGEAMIAANTAVMRVDGFAMMPNFTFGTAATTYIGQNVGAGRGDRLKPGLKAMLILALTSSTIMVGGILLLGHNLIGMFTDTPLTMQLGVQGLQTLAFGYICFSVTQVLQGTMRGAGETQVPMWISFFATVILRLPLAYIMAYFNRTPGADSAWPNGQPSALFVSLLISWVVAMLITIVTYRMKWWRRKLPGQLGDML